MSTIKVNRIENTATTDGGIDIDSSGRIAVGGTTVTDSNLLNIQGTSASSNIGLVLNDTNTSKIYGIQNGGSALKFFDYTASAERFRISSDGKLGVGTSSPAHGLLTLSQSASSAFNALVIQQGNTGSAATDGLHIGIDSGVNAYITHKESRALVFGTANTERMRLNSDGKLLVETTTANAAPLTVNGTTEALGSKFRAVFGDGFIDADSGRVFGANPAEVQIHTVSASRPAVLSLGGPQGTSESLGMINFFNSGNGDDHRSRAMIVAVQEGSNSNQGAALRFYTAADGGSSPLERMRLDSSGRLLVGTTSATQGASEGNLVMQFAGNSRNGIKTRDTDNTGTVNHLIFVSGSTTIGSISGTTGATSFNNLSDYRKKENDVEIADGIEKIKLLRPIRFNYIVDPNTTCDGFFAHEVAPAVPTAVTGAKDALDSEGKIDPQMLDTSKLVPLLTAALQEAISKIETLETQHATLLARVTALEAA